MMKLEQLKDYFNTQPSLLIDFKAKEKRQNTANSDLYVSNFLSASVV